MFKNPDIPPNLPFDKKPPIEKEEIFESENKKEKKDEKQENAEENIDFIKERIEERYGKDDEMGSSVLYDYLMRVFYRRYNLHHCDNEQCAEDAKMIEIMKFFQESLDELMRDLRVNDEDFFDSHVKQFQNLAQKTIVFFGRHSEMIKSRRFRYNTAFTLFLASSYFKVSSHDFKFMISKVIDLRGPKHVRDRLDLIGDDNKEKIFHKISELVSLVQKEDDELAKNIFKHSDKKIFSGIREELFRKVNDIIFKFGEELKDTEKIDKSKIDKLLTDLEQSRIEIDLVASLLVASKKAGEVQYLEDIRGVEISKAEEKELEENPELWNKLQEMYRANNSGKSKEDLERLMQSFKENRKYDPKFYLIYFDKDSKEPQKNLDNLVGFGRSSNFDGQRELPKGERYLGAANINPILQRIYLFENFLREIVEKEFQNGTQKIIAHLPEGGASHKALKSLGLPMTETQEGEYKNDDGSVLAKRLLVELTEK